MDTCTEFHWTSPLSSAKSFTVSTRSVSTMVSPSCSDPSTKGPAMTRMPRRWDNHEAALQPVMLVV
jgi:hypothetical protein